jgi:signal transduction histidine kinase
MRWISGISLKRRLFLLVAAAFIPVAVLVVFVAEEQKSLETEAILHKTLMIARAAANVENEQLGATGNLLAAIAEALSLADHHWIQVSGMLTRLRSQVEGHADFGVLSKAGLLLAGSEPPPGKRPDFRDRSWFTACLERKELTIGPYRGDHIGGDSVLYVARPVLDSQGQVREVVFAALDLDWVNRNIFRQLTQLPKGSRLTLVDESRGMLRYDVDTGRWSVPDHFAPSLRRHILQRRVGTLRAVDENRVRRIYAFAPLASAFRDRQITVVLEVPQRIALAASNRIFIRNVALLLTSALMALLSIWWVGDVLILRRVRAMVSASRRLASGDLAARIGKSGARDELSHLTEVFNEMAASLQIRLEREARVLASLERSREQLRMLAAHQQGVREEERIRIARELHDRFGQALTLLKMDLSWLKKRAGLDAPEALQKMNTMSEVIDDALTILHAVTSELRPGILDDFGLAAAIEWQIEEFRNRSGISCQMETSGFEPVLSKDLATALFRIFQETLTNILRHAEADRVAVRLEAVDGRLQLRVEDNGRGITEAQINDPQSYGLLGMRERLHPWNGRVSFEGRPGKGTAVTVRLPMPSKGASP